MKNKKNIIFESSWLFIIGCFIGYIIEVLCYFVKHGIWLNKKGLIFGPFKPVYGVGTVILSLFAKKNKNNNILYLFLMGIIFGSLYEYLTSLFQEFVLGTSTWNYASFNLNINGRIYIPYCIGWGLITLIYVKYLFPYITKLINKIPCTISLICLILMSYNVILSTIVVYEYSSRNNNKIHDNFIARNINKKFDDEYMKKYFPKIKIIKK